MSKDSGIEQISQKVSIKIKVNQLEVERAINLTFKGLNELLESGVNRVKIPHLCTFRKRKNLKEENNPNKK